MKQIENKKSVTFLRKNISNKIQIFRNRRYSQIKRKFNHFGNDSREKEWRKPNTEVKKYNVNAKVKHGGGNMLMWGYFSASVLRNSKFIECTTNASVYTDILKKNLTLNVEKLGIQKKK